MCMVCRALWTSTSTAVPWGGDGMLGTANADSLPWGEGGSEFSPIWCRGVVSRSVLRISGQDVWSWQAFAITFYQGRKYVL